MMLQQHVQCSFTTTHPGQRHQAEAIQVCSLLILLVAPVGYALVHVADA